MDRLTRPDLAPPGTRVVNMNQLAEALAGELPGPPVRALYVYNCNPAAVAPDQSKVLEGLMRDDLFTVVHEQFATDTVDYADIVLPATTQLEHIDVHGSYGHHFVMLNPPAIAPRGEARSNNDVFRALAARLGFEPDLFPDDETLIREALDGGPTARGITLERLRAEGSVRLNLPERYAPFADGVFPTPSGKCELYSERMQADGLDPLPDLHPAPRGPADPPRPGRARTRSSCSARRGRSSSTRPSPTPRPPRRRRRPDGRAGGRGRRGAAAWSTASGPRSTTTGAVPRPRRPDRGRPAGRRRRHRPLLEQAQSPAAATPTAPPRPP